MEVQGGEKLTGVSHLNNGRIEQQERRKHTLGEHTKKSFIDKYKKLKH